MSKKTRRDFLYVATGACGAIGLVGAAWPLVAQFGPDANTVAENNQSTFDLTPIEPGGHVLVQWQGNPYFIRHLTNDEILTAKQAAKDEFFDFASAQSRIHSHEESTTKWSVVSAQCTHLSCVLNKVDRKKHGWNCPCHGARFDVVGRVVKGPAPINLPQPPFKFISESKILFGGGETSQMKDAMKQLGH